MIQRSPKPTTLEILASVRALNAQLRRTNEQLQRLLAFDPLTVHAHQSPACLAVRQEITAPGSMRAMNAFSPLSGKIQLQSRFTKEPVVLALHDLSGTAKEAR